VKADEDFVKFFRGGVVQKFGLDVRTILMYGYPALDDSTVMLKLLDQSLTKFPSKIVRSGIQPNNPVL